MNGVDSTDIARKKAFATYNNLRVNSTATRLPTSSITSRYIKSLLDNMLNVQCYTIQEIIVYNC